MLNYWTLDNVKLSVMSFDYLKVSSINLYVLFLMLLIELSIKSDKASRILRVAFYVPIAFLTSAIWFLIFWGVILSLMTFSCVKSKLITPLVLYSIAFMLAVFLRIDNYFLGSAEGLYALGCLGVLIWSLLVAIQTLYQTEISDPCKYPKLAFLIMLMPLLSNSIAENKLTFYFMQALLVIIPVLFILKHLGKKYPITTKDSVFLMVLLSSIVTMWLSPIYTVQVLCLLLMLAEAKDLLLKRFEHYKKYSDLLIVMIIGFTPLTPMFYETLNLVVLSGPYGLLNAISLMMLILSGLLIIHSKTIKISLETIKLDLHKREYQILLFSYLLVVSMVWVLLLKSSMSDLFSSRNLLFGLFSALLLWPVHVVAKYKQRYSSFIYRLNELLDSGVRGLIEVIKEIYSVIFLNFEKASRKAIGAQRQVLRDLWTLLVNAQPGEAKPGIALCFFILSLVLFYVRALN